MRWDGLFDDLEAQAEQLEREERAGEIDERTRGEIGRLGLVDRLRAALGQPLRLRVDGGLALAGTLVRVGPEWLLLDEGAGREVVVPTPAVVGVRGLPRYATPPGSGGIVEARLGLRHALRGIARDRSAVRLHLRDGATLDATIDRVGADHLEAAVHPAGELRRRQDVRETELIPLAGVAAVRRWGD